MINTAQNLKEYKKRLKKALDNKFLRSAMGTFATAYKEAQGRLFQGVDVEGLRREIARGKDEALPRLEELYQAFKARAEAAGVKVHLAATAREANEIIAGIARDNGVKKIVKSKSMTAEETFLNDHLEEPRASRWWKRTWGSGSSSCATKGRPTWSCPPSTCPGRRWRICSPRSPASPRNPTSATW